ncbi:methyltransferase [Thalassomonas sp. M1454]|uniref:methyltransferase n=1 Tax=Thalassomonas sp. M1454 TaxID=2594477 RepID=UPI00117FB66B|nr:methyltransferase [Thalassomonas sp. M1454]TRX55881.1 methyltransferase [Thalassomonas sp. M1454]
MSLSNPSQLLLRNSELLKSNHPLVVGCPDNEFLAELISINPQAQITSYQTHFGFYQNTKARYQDSVTSCFAASYENPTSNKHDLAIIYFPKSKPEYQFLLAMLAPHMAEGANILVVGENKGGVKSCEKLSTKYSSCSNKIDSARHCSLFSVEFNNQDFSFDINDFYKEFNIDVAGIKLKVASLPGVFSSGSLDNGTRILLENLPSQITGSVLDFGCGAGIIGAFINKTDPTTKVDLVDVSALAIASSIKTLELNQLKGKVFASDALSNVSAQYNSVISNPPFHQGIKTNYHATESFLKYIKQHMTKNANLTIVANNFLKYAPILKAEIAEPELLINSKGFAVHYCKK